jgi:hypothetical protein
MPTRAEQEEPLTTAGSGIVSSMASLLGTMKVLARGYAPLDRNKDHGEDLLLRVRPVGGH